MPIVPEKPSNNYFLLVDNGKDARFN